MIGAAMRLLFGSRPSKPGYLAQCAAQTTKAETAPNAETGRGGACQSSGYQRPTWAHTQYSSIFVNGCTHLGQIALRMWDTSLVWMRGLGHNTRLSNTHWPAPVLSTAGPETQGHSLGMWLAPAWPAPSTVPHTHGCKTACSRCEGRALIAPGWVSAACRSVRRILTVSCLNHIAFVPHHPIVEQLPATGEDVFNLEVAGDHSYIAAGVVVHNCDLLASQNLYGLGRGVYPDAKRCPWPAHPNTLSFVEMVFDTEVTAADRAGKETPMQAMARLPADVRDGVLGKTKATYFDQGLLGQGSIRSKLKAVDARHERQGILPEMTPKKIETASIAAIHKFVAEGMTGKVDQRLLLGPIGGETARFVREKLERDPANLTRTLEASAVRHTLKQHGNAATEAARGQVAITAADFERVQKIATGGRRELSDRTSRGSPVVKIQLSLGGYDYTVLEVVRRDDVTLGTMWKKKIKGP